MFSNIATVLLCAFLPVVLTFPYPVQLRTEFANKPICHGFTGSQLADALDEYNRFILSLKTREKVTIIPHNVPKREDLWADYHHLNDHGSQILAQNISVDLEKIISNLLRHKTDATGTDL